MARQRLMALTRTEFLLLEIPAPPAQVLTRSASSSTFGAMIRLTSNSLGVYIGYLRRKLELVASPAAAHRARRRLRAARAAMSFRAASRWPRRGCAIAVVLASALTYLLTSDQLHGQVDTQLRNRAHELYRLAPVLQRTLQSAGEASPGSPGSPFPRRPVPLTGHTLSSLAGARRRQPVRAPAARPTGARLPAGGRLQRRILLRSGSLTLPVSGATRTLAQHGGSPCSAMPPSGHHLRILAERFGNGRALQLAQP